MKTYVLGDIGGHVDVFKKSLRQMGVEEDLIVPEGTRIIQIGDLVRSRSNFRAGNTELVNMVEKIIDRNKDKWTQLLGNHEASVLGGAVCKAWNIQESYEPQCVKNLQKLWKRGDIKLADTVKTKDKNYLVTHAGLTRGFWNRLWNPGTPDAASKIINISIGKDVYEFESTGVVTDGNLNLNADFIWAGTSQELLTPWIENEDELPFSQIHGHGSPWSWNQGVKNPYSTDAILSRSEIMHDKRRSITSISDKEIISIDWVLENYNPESIWEILCLDELP